ncbi:unnamed protein product [Echinostoma caproni]|uniref:Uncharacterized protein n=1 Tax=Echinostoma caproni TaxID=27848 RepID=A0A183AQW7_9TREM|nr:unnamed protein product [Echinostoma caproni]
MNCDVDGDFVDPVNSFTSASDRSTLLLYRNDCSTHDVHESTLLNQSDDCHTDPMDTIQYNRSSSTGRLRSGRMALKLTRKERMRNALKLWRLRKRWEKEYDKQK